MAIIGYNTVVGYSGQQQLSTSKAVLHSAASYTPPVDEYLVSFHLHGVSTGAPRAVNVAVYDITGGIIGATLTGSSSLTVADSAVGDTWNEVTGLSILLTAGRTYAIEFFSSSSTFYASKIANTGACTSDVQTTTPSATFSANTVVGDLDRNYAFYAVTEAVATGPTITGPDSTTEGSVTVQTGTLQDTIVTQSLISGSYSIAQTIDSATATTLNYVAESGVNQCTPSTPVAGVPLEPTITAAGITPYVVQQKADDGVNPPATRNITLNPEATHDVIQTMAGVANTIPDQSIFGSTWVTVEDNHQARLPKVVDGVTFTWNDKGEFTTDIDKTVTFQYELFSPASGNWSAISLTVKDTSIISVGMVTVMVSSMVSNMVEDM